MTHCVAMSIILCNKFLYLTDTYILHEFDIHVEMNIFKKDLTFYTEIFIQPLFGTFSMEKVTYIYILSQ